MSGWNPFPPKVVESDVLFLGNPAGISAYAEQQTNAANTFLLRLGDAAANLIPPTIDPVFPTGPTAPALTTPAPPELQPVVWTAPDAPPVFTGDLNVDDLMPEPFDDDPPALVFGSAPTFTDVAPDAPGIDTSFEMPTLDVSLPAAPDLLSLSVVPFDGITIPEIDFTVPELTIEAPSIREYVPGAQYTSALLTSVRASLQDVIDNGSTGLDANVENAIWDRGREREARSRADSLRELDRFEEMGFGLPPGVFVDARIKITTESDFTNRGISREIMIKQAELAYQAGKDRLDQAIVLEGRAMDYSNAVEQRLFESCKYATEAGVSIYNARVQAYAAFVDAYKAKVAIYEAQVRAELANVEVYKAQIEAEGLKATINRSLVESYQVQVTAALSNVEIYKAQIGGIQAKAEIERNKIMIFGEQVKAFASRVQAYTAGVEGFRATIEAESSKQMAFRSAVDAYSARVTAGTKVIEARIAAFRGQLDANIGRWDGYKAAYQAEAAKAQAISSYNQSLSQEFTAEAGATSAYNDNLTKQWQVALDQAQRVSDIGVNAAKANAELYITARSLVLDAAKVGAQVSAQLGAAALNAINWSQSISTSTAVGYSESFSLSQSIADSESTNTNYNYSASV
jgi:hypothetical protein